MKETLKKSLKILTQLTGVSGEEQEVIKYLKDELELVADSVQIDSWGNIIATKRGRSEGPRFMVMAHADEIGLIVKAITQSGYIMFNKVGTGGDVTLPARKVFINGSIPGVIGVKAGHLQTAEERKTLKPASQCYIDVGAGSKQEVLDMGVNIGDRIVFKSDFFEMSNKDLVCTKAIDDRVGCAIILELFKQLNPNDFEGTFYGAISIQEEIGLRGAAMIGNQVEVDYAIALDTIPSGDTPDIAPNQLPISLGNGPACPLMDGIGGQPVANIVHTKVKQMIKKQAQEQDINIQFVTLAGEMYTTDSTFLTVANGGIATGVLAVPRRYSHSPVEVANINDAVDTYKILMGIVKSNGQADWSFL